MAKGCAILNGSSASIYGPTALGATTSWGGWFYMANRVRDTNQHFVYMNADTDIGLRMNASNALQVSGFPNTITPQPQSGEWFYLAMVSEDGVGTRVYRYDDTQTQLSSSFSASWDYGTAIDDFIIGNNAETGGSGGWPSSGLRVSNFRLWSTALSEAQIEAEMASTTPVITASLIDSFENDPVTDGWSVSATVTADTASWPPNYDTGGSAPSITDAGDETYTNGETGIVITGTSFGASQGSGTVKISPTDNVNDANAVTQTVTTWGGDTSITFTAVRGSLAPSTNMYLFVTKDGGYSNASGHLVSFNQVVTITGVSDTTLIDGQTSIVITGTDFQSTQGTGRVVISPTNSISDGSAVAQTVTSWSNDSITFTATRGSLAFSTNHYLFVENDDDVSNSTGYTVQFTGTKKLRVAVPPAAAGVSGVYGVVWAEPDAVASPNAGYTFDAVGEKLETTGSLALTDQSFTVFCWIKVADGTPSATTTAVSIGNSAYASDRYCALQLTSADGYARALAYETTSSSSTTASNGTANDTWFAIAGLFTRNTSSQVTSVQAWSWNGTNESLSTAVTGLTKQMSTFNVNRIGVSRTGAGDFTGLISHVAVWNKVLSSAELTALRTQPPSVVATSNLIAYWPLVDDANADVGSGINLTATGATLTAGAGPYPQLEQAGTEIGEFTNQSFESSTEGGLAILKVPVTAFGGSSLTTSDTPVVLVQTSTHTTGLIEATIIEE